MLSVPARRLQNAVVLRLAIRERIKALDGVMMTPDEVEALIRDIDALTVAWRNVR